MHLTELFSQFPSTLTGLIIDYLDPFNDDPWLFDTFDLCKLSKYYIKLIINDDHLLLTIDHFKQNLTAKCYFNNFQYWYLDDQFHRLDGPAVVYVDGTQFWYFHGRYHRLDGPALISNGTQEWWLHDQRHRLDGPAIINSNGTQEWWLHGQRHRLDGPAINNPNGSKKYYINGIQLTCRQFYRRIHNRKSQRQQNHLLHLLS